MRLEDLELIERVRAGESEAFGQLVHRYQDRVFNACWRICGNLEDARDIAQDAFMRVFESLDTFRQESGFYTWLFRTAVNLALTRRRREASRREVSLDGLAESANTQAEALVRMSDRANPAEEVAHREMVEQQRVVARALHNLDIDHRAVVVLRDIVCMDYQEIATVLGIPPGTVKSRLHRARLELRKALFGSDFQ